MQLSKYFTLEEFTNSETARARGINNTPPAEVVVNIVRLHDNVISKIRKNLGHPVIITSGYRCAALNSAVGGASNSQHVSGQACDFVVQGQSCEAIVNWCRQNLVFDQLILEQPNNAKWVHISYNIDSNRKQVLKYNGKTYTAY